MDVINLRPTQKELAKKQDWVQKHFEDDRVPPFSFYYGNIAFSEVYKDWEKSSFRRHVDTTRDEITLTYKGKDGLVITCYVIEYLDHAAVEWTVYIENTGVQNSQMLSDVLGIDTVFFNRMSKNAPPVGNIKLYSNKGDTCAHDCYEPIESFFYKDKPLCFYPYGGRPTFEQFPYYRLQGEAEGMIFVLSWQGQWKTGFVQVEDGLCITGGQKELCTYLLPGEKIRTPLSLVLFYDGTENDRAVNLWRRWFLEHNTPRVQGQLIPPFYANYPGRIYSEMEQATEENLKSYADCYLNNNIPFDYLWIDAGWYDMGPGMGWPCTGTWKVDEKRFPNGLRAVTDYVREKSGVKTMLWFEPERVVKGTELYNEHLEWCLPSKASEESAIEHPEHPWKGSLLLNLGNPEAREWITNRLVSIIRDEGIDLYRQDFNMNPLEHWLENDEPARRGITENHHCTGYLKMWDDILEAFPDIIIDSCSSGGQRNDLETVRRSLPLHKTDYNYGDLTSKQGFHHTLFQWFPFFGSFNWPADQKDIYYQRSSVLLSFHGCEDPFQPGYDFSKNREWMMEWREVAHCFYGDYFQLTPYSRDEREWIGWQFNLEDTGEGLIQVFMRPMSPFREAAFCLKNLDEHAKYAVKDYNRGVTANISGRDLMNKGLQMSMEKSPDSCLYYYKKV